MGHRILRHLDPKRVYDILVELQTPETSSKLNRNLGGGRQDTKAFGQSELRQYVITLFACKLLSRRPKHVTPISPSGPRSYSPVQETLERIDNIFKEAISHPPRISKTRIISLVAKAEHLSPAEAKKITVHDVSPLTSADIESLLFQERTYEYRTTAEGKRFIELYNDMGKIHPKLLEPTKASPQTPNRS